MNDKTISPAPARPAAISATLELTADDVARAYQLHTRVQLWSKTTLLAMAVTLVILFAFLFEAFDDWRAIVVILALAWRADCCFPEP